MQFTDIVPKGVISGRRGEDAVSLLIADHLKVQDLFRQFEELKEVGDGPALEEKQRIASEVCLELTMHMTLEEEIFYPAVRALTDDDDLINEAEIEHQGVKQMIDELGATSAEDGMFNARVKVLSDYVNHHIREEQAETFRKARDADLDLMALGEQLMARKRELAENAEPQLMRVQPTRKPAPRKSTARGQVAAAKHGGRQSK